MGWFSASEEITEENVVDSNGHVNNNIVIQEAKDNHIQAAASEKLLSATYLLITIEVVKLCICFYNMWRRQIKKKYNDVKPNPTPRV